MKTSKVFALAKVKLARDVENLFRREKYICHAIDASVAVTYSDREEAKDLINERLGGCGTLESWLYDNITGAAKLDRTNRTAFLNKVQATRHAWVDSLIAEFKAKGD